MGIKHVLPYLVDTGFAVDYSTATANEIRQHMWAVSLRLEEELRLKPRLCSLLGHTIIGRYQLKGDVTEVLSQMILFRAELMSKTWTREELINLSDNMSKRCRKFLEETYYASAARAEADRLHDEVIRKMTSAGEFDRPLSKKSDKSLEDYQVHLHNGKQCLCHCN